MSLKDTTKNLRSLLQAVSSDLDKAENGNKAASQRVRTGTIRLEKIAKLFRKESIKSERNGGGSKKKKGASSGSSKGAASKAPSKSAKKPTAQVKKGGSKKAKAKPKSLSKKRPTAKILKKK